MATLNASKWGYVGLDKKTTHTAVRDGTEGSFLASNPTTAYAAAINYSVVINRRGIDYTIVRAFYYFNTTGISSTVASASINIAGDTNNSADVIVVQSDAFGGGGSNLATGDYNKIFFATPYSSEFTSWTTSGNNSITLNSTALSAIETQNSFICAVIEYDHDYSDVDPGVTSTYRNGIDYTTTGYLDYTLAGGGSGPANVSSVNGVAAANINTWNGTAWSNITSINGVT